MFAYVKKDWLELFNKKEDGFNFEGTILSFLLSSDQFWEKIFDHDRELKKAQGHISVPTLSETDRKTILDHWKTEKRAKLQILWNILLKQHSMILETVNA